MKKSSKQNNQSTPNQEKQPQTSQSVKQRSSTLSDFKLTIITNTVLICIIGFLVNKAFVKTEEYKDCSDYYDKGFRQDGVYSIWPEIEDDSQSFWSSLLSATKKLNSNQAVRVYCDMSSGGLTSIFRKHFNSDTNFQVGIEAYKRGFGDPSRDYFLGLETISKLTSLKSRELVAILNSTQVRYSYFQVLNEFHHYKLIIDGELDRLPDDATLLKLNNTFFSTIDLDFDMAANSNCSSGWNAGWWFTDCFDHTVCMTCSYLHCNTGLKILDYAALLIK